MKRFLSVLILLALTAGVSQAQYVKLWEKTVGNYSWFKNDHYTRSLALNPVSGHLLVASRTGGQNIYILNAATGDSLGKLDMTGVSGGTYALNMVRVAKDGAIYACNLANAAADQFKIYRWANETSVPTVAYSAAFTTRLGDIIAVSGEGTGTIIYASGSNTLGIEVYTTTDGAAFTKNKTIPLTAAIARGGISPVENSLNSELWVDASGTSTTHISADGKVINAVDGGILSSGWHNVVYFQGTNGKKYIAVVGKNEAAQGRELHVLDVTNNEKYPGYFIKPSLTKSAYATNSNATGDVAIKDNGNNTYTIYWLVTNNGFAAVKTNLMSVAEARVDANNDYKPDRLGDTVMVKGVVFTPNFSTTGRSFYIWDGTAGINIYKSSSKLATFNMGDSIAVTGKIALYKGLTELEALDSAATLIADSARVPEALEVKIADLKANGEKYEGSLIVVRDLNKATGTWPAAGGYATLKMVNASDTVDVYINKYTFNTPSVTPEPTYPKDVVGVATQFSSLAIPNNGYQVYPRDINDFKVPVPVELATFKADVNGASVNLRWTTATETNNAGFEVYRNGAMVTFIKGNGSTSEKTNYSFADRNLNSGKYAYTLIQVDYNGAKEIVATAEVEVKSTPTVYALNQNYPNPFNPSTSIRFALPVEAKVSMKIFNLLGEEVARLVNGNMTAGQHTVAFDGSRLNSGVYFYTLEAKGVDGSNFVSTKKMTLIK